jgi:hypothetical protein
MSTRARLAIRAAYLIAAVVGSGAAAATPPCDAPNADPFLADLRTRTLAYNALARYAIAEHGGPLGCDGSVTAEFDGMKFGTIKLEFSGGVALEVATQPPESSAVTLSAPSGFADAARARQELAAYAEGIGLRIDWNHPTAEVEGRRRVETFTDPDPGLNAFARLTYEDGVLVALSLSMAL